jgi:Ni2+-binding GTPase involved in maturation of urease and hydrogenase
MRSPTRDQQTVLESNARIRVVRAVPGSGKTWLIAEIIRQSLDKGPKGTSGIAAL